MSKLFETVDKLEDYILEDDKDKITIERIDIFTSKKGERYYFEKLPDKSLRLFYSYGTVIGFIYFDDINYKSMFGNFFRNYEDDCEVNKFDSIYVRYINGDKKVIGIEWNSLMYELDDDHFIILFVGKDGL